MKNRILTVAVCLCLSPLLLAQEQQPDQKDQDKQDPVTVFPHPERRWWVSGQMNVIFQAHEDFPARYSGANSLRNTAEHATSRVFTLYTGLEVAKGTELLFDVESVGGRGISDALGLAGFTNVDVVRNPDLGQTPYVARIMLHQTVALSKEQTEQERNQFALAGSVPKRRLEFRLGKMSVVDFFDQNQVGSDGHLQFTNWTTVNNGGYDYAADTRGYTYGAIVEYQQPRFGARFGEFLMPKVANGIDLEWNLRRAHAENLEVEFRPVLLKDKQTNLRLLSYWNTADMGDYRAAVALFLSGVGSRPDVTATRRQGTLKYGLGFDADQELPHDFRAFLRLGWNEGRHESFAYSEVNSTASFGVDLAGTKWHRKLDKVGSAFTSNGISADQQEYLRLGGLGFLLGDGTLRYGRENIWESYYTAHLWRGVFASPLLQFIANPGYNQDRGPVWVPGARLHVDF